MDKKLRLTGLNRDLIDKFYTKSEVAKQCLKIFKDKVNTADTDLIIEPSAGNGSFSNLLIKEYNNVLSYDIYPQNSKIIKQDYLIMDNIANSIGKIHIIGNPPFGRQSSIAKKFIKKSCLFGDTVAFILPKSFKKESFQKVFPLNFHKITEKDLPENSFEIDNKNHNVPCVFQVWIRKEYKRPIKVIEKPTFFTFAKKSENPSISFRRVGINAGNIDKVTENKSEQSHYFIKLNDNINISDFFNKYDTIKFEEDNTVGPKSISKQELILEFNKLNFRD